jgi:uncharacterized protein with ParB-like and HNH nuclease domain
VELSAAVMATGNLLAGMSIYDVPAYQREYSWEIDDVESLLEDLLVVHESEVNPRPKHFLGSIVLNKKTSGNDQFELVDGQQRLTTMCLFLSALFTLKIEIEKDLPHLNQEQVDTVSNYLDTINAIKNCLTFTQEDATLVRVNLYHENDYFQKLIRLVFRSVNSSQIPEQITNLINQGSTRLSIKNIANNFEYLHRTIQNKIADFAPADKLRFLSQMTNIALWRVNFVTISTTTLRDSLVIFRTLNSRGVELNPSDVIKALYIQQTETFDHTTNLWKTMEEVINVLPSPSTSNALTRYLRHWFISTESYIDESELIETYQKKTSDKVYANNSLRRLSEEKETYAFVASGGDIIPNAFSQVEFEIKLALSNITKILNVTAVYPLFLASGKFLQTPKNQHVFAQICKLVESFVFRNFTCNRRVTISKLEKLMCEIALDVRKDKIDDIFPRMLEISDEDNFVRDFSVYKSTQRRQLFYTVLKFEHYLLGSMAGGIVPFGQSPTQHLEHILPAKPISLSDWNITSSIQHQEYLNRIGNLLVLEQQFNTHIQNKDFTYKVSNASRLDYKNSRLFLPRELSAMELDEDLPVLPPTVDYKFAKPYMKDSAWGINAIEMRQSHMAQYAKHVWPLSKIQE